MAVKTAMAKYAVEHRDRTHYFCGRGCKNAFERRPEKYLDSGYKPSMKAAFFDWARALLPAKKER
jgi:YHS domain-containing protein